MAKMFADLLAVRPVLFDGAMGTEIQGRNLTAADFGGEQFAGCNEHLNLTRPEVIQSIHESYLAAGADVIETNTFGATPLVLGEFGLSDKAVAINHAAVAIAKAAIAKYTEPKYIAGSIGPTTKSLSLLGGITFDELKEHFRVQAQALIEAGVDLLLFETVQDLLNLKAGLIAVQELGAKIPVMISLTIERNGTTLGGQTIEAALASIEHFHPLIVGLNCATGPAELGPYVRALSERAPFFTSVLPNAGLPDEHGRYSEAPHEFADKMQSFLQQGFTNVIGGCCGTTPAHIAALKQKLSALTPGVTGHQPLGSPRIPAAHHTTLWLAGLEFVEPDTSNPQLLVGERTNSIGSRKFKELVGNTKYEEAAEIGRAQVKAGAQILDLCTANPDRDETADFAGVLRELVKKVKVPIMLDTTDKAVLEEGLKLTQGKCIINSINLENGLERFQEVVPLVKKYGAALVVGLIDEEGMAVTYERKIAVAERSYQILTTEFQVDPTDIIFDPLVFPVGTGDPNFVGSAEATFRALAEIHRRFPLVSSTLGISNCSFGLPPLGREVLNSVYLYRATQAGLNLPIVDAGKLRRYATISDIERLLAEELIATGSKEAIEKFAAHFRDQTTAPVRKSGTLTPTEVVQQALLDGSKTGLIEALTTLLGEQDALAIINGVLMPGMAEVGRLFGENKLIVAEVLQSAEVMKAAVDYLKPHLKRGENAKVGKLLLATVKGDVHDIGKNLVEIIFANNGFEVINLGIKVESSRLIEAARLHQPDLIGLSGLLVRSAQEMAATAADFRAAGLTIPLLVGGAALSPQFTQNKIAPAYAPTEVAYARDAMAGLRLAKELLANRGQGLGSRVQSVVTQSESKDARADGGAVKREKQSIQPYVSPQPPDFTAHIFQPATLAAVYDKLDLQMLFGKHMGFMGHFRNELKKENPKAVKLWTEFQAFQTEIAERQLLQPQAIWQFFRARRVGEQTIALLDADDRQLFEFSFPVRPRTGLSLADFVSGEVPDFVACFVATAGSSANAAAQQFKESGEYLKSHFLAALALETAEATAELVHGQICTAWGIEPESGGRVSFGYPACPELADQQKLFTLLDPSRIGVELTSGLMMSPEASVSALVFAHPDTTKIYE